MLSDGLCLYVILMLPILSDPCISVHVSLIVLRWNVCSCCFFEWQHPTGQTVRNSSVSLTVVVSGIFINSGFCFGLHHFSLWCRTREFIYVFSGQHHLQRLHCFHLLFTWVFVMQSPMCLWIHAA